MRERYTIKHIIETGEWAVITIKGGEKTAEDRFGPTNGPDAIDHLTSLFAKQHAEDMAAIYRSQAEAVFNEAKTENEREVIREWWRRLAADEQEAIFDKATAYFGDGVTIPDCYHLYETGKIRLEAVAV